MKYFRIAADCHFVEGKKNSAIYDVSRNKVYLLSTEASAIIKKLEKNYCIDDFNINNLMQINSFLKKLQGKGLGFFYSKPFYNEKFILNAPIGPATPLIKQNYFKKASLSITNECNLNCYFCPMTTKTITWQACLSCIRREDSVYQQNHYDFTNISNQLSMLGISELHIRGGNPFLAMDRLLEIVSTIRKSNKTTIFITTPGSGQSIDQIVKLVTNQNLILNITMTGVTPSDSVGGLRNSKLIKHQIDLIDTLKKKGLTFIITFLLSGISCEKRLEFLKYAYKRWRIIPKFAEIYNEEEISNEFKFSHLLFYKKKLYPWESKEAFFHRVKSNSCFSNSLDISIDGKIRICAGMDRICGEIQENDLKNALKRSDIYDLWKINKNDFNQCNICALRYACLDCSSIEFRANCDPKLKSTFCSFSPNRRIKLDEFSWEHRGFISELEIQSKRGKNG